MRRVWFLTHHRKDRSPGQRFRFEQYLQFLEEHGLQPVFCNLLNEHEDRVFYGNSVWKKILIGLKGLFQRVSQLMQVRRQDVVFVFRDGFFFGTFMERWYRRRSQFLLFDFDDSIWIPDINPNQGIFNKLKNPAKTARIIALSDLVIAGNAYLAEYAGQYNPNVVIIPTTIDTEAYQKKKVYKPADKICIGWSGSFSTIKHFETVVPALVRVREKYEERVYFKVIGDGTYSLPELGIVGLPWKKESELKDLSELDIGLMPLPNDEWSRGKCGLKGLQYMALEIATIMSPVGVNTDIIQEGENGFLAATEDEWVEKLSLLIENESLRRSVGLAGRRTVVQHYSVEANKEKYLSAFNKLVGR